MADTVELPQFPCVRKACLSTFTQVGPCYKRSTTGVQQRVVTCENCLHSYGILWHEATPEVRIVSTLIPPWSTEGKRLLKGIGLYDQADPRVYEGGIVPDRYKPKSARR